MSERVFGADKQAYKLRNKTKNIICWILWERWRWWRH